MDECVAELDEVRRFLGPLKLLAIGVGSGFDYHKCQVKVADCTADILPFPPIPGLRSHNWRHSWKKYAQ
jgi:hypothetical protein